MDGGAFPAAHVVRAAFTGNWATPASHYTAWPPTVKALQRQPEGARASARGAFRARRLRGRAEFAPPSSCHVCRARREILHCMAGALALQTPI